MSIEVTDDREGEFGNPLASEAIEHMELFLDPIDGEGVEGGVAKHMELPCRAASSITYKYIRIHIVDHCITSKRNTHSIPQWIIWPLF